MKTRTSLLSVTLAYLCLIGCSSSAPKNNNELALREYKNAAGQLESLTFFGSNAKDALFAKLEKATTLKELLVQECDRASDAALAGVSAASELERVTLSHVPFTDNALPPFQGLEKIKELTIVRSQIDGSGLSNFSASPIEKFLLTGDELTPEGMESLASLSNLKELVLQTNSVTVDEIPALGKLRQLEILDAKRSEVGTGGLAVLTGLDQLKILRLNSANVDDDSLAALNSLTSLEELELLSSSLSDAGLSQLRLPNLRSLRLEGSEGITDEGIANLTGLPKLETLGVEFTSVQGLNLEALASNANLKEFRIHERDFAGTKDDIDSLKAKLPSLQISIIAD